MTMAGGNADPRAAGVVPGADASLGQEPVRRLLAGQSHRWLVTGAAGFIGSNLVEALLRLGQQVTGLDSFVTGHRHNLDEVRALVGEDAWQRFRFVEGDINDAAAVRDALDGCSLVLHQAALGSVPRSIADPLPTHEANVNGFARLIEWSRQHGIRRFVYASSSSVYGDSPELPKVEARTGNPLSPYAAGKAINEQIGAVYARCYGMTTVGLRYFNVFGPRQDPEGAYAAVIPKWTAALLRGDQVTINGDGETSRDFCFVNNAVQANLLGALADLPAGQQQVFNIAVGDQTTLNQLHDAIVVELRNDLPAGAAAPTPNHGPFRAGDIRHSLADTTRARELLGYAPAFRIADGLRLAMPWYVARERALQD